jgi:hypothetical protein
MTDVTDFQKRLFVYWDRNQLWIAHKGAQRLLPRNRFIKCPRAAWVCL